jgi:hypothetical protein
MRFFKRKGPKLTQEMVQGLVEAATAASNRAEAEAKLRREAEVEAKFRELHCEALEAALQEATREPAPPPPTRAFGESDQRLASVKPQQGSYQ